MSGPLVWYTSALGEEDAAKRIEEKELSETGTSCCNLREYCRVIDSLESCEECWDEAF